MPLRSRRDAGAPDERLAIVYADGGSRGNPGPAGAGVVIKDGTADGSIVAEYEEYIGFATNNVAEYSALVTGLKGALELGYDAVEVRMDSELIVKQMSGEYRVKNAKLVPLHQEAKRWSRQFKSCRIVHVPREQNREADKLANQAMDQAKIDGLR